MRTQWRTQADRDAEQDVLKALDQLEAKKSMRDLSPPMTQREHQARDKIEHALIHAREVAETWDQKSLGLLKEGRDLLREEYDTIVRSPLHQQDLYHCDKAMQTIERDGPDIHAYGYHFVAHTDSQDREGYALFDNNPHSHPHTRWQEIAVIYPKDTGLPVHSENNASLSLRDYGTFTWQSRGTHSLHESLRRAAQHAERHYEKYGPADARFDEYIDEQTLADRDPEKSKEQTKEQTTQTSFADRVKERIHKIKEQRAAQQQSRDKDRERD